MSNLNVTLKCAICRGELSVADDLAEDAPVTCCSCGAHVGTWSEVKKLIVDSIEQQFIKELA